MVAERQGLFSPERGISGAPDPKPQTTDPHALSLSLSLSLALPLSLPLTHFSLSLEQVVAEREGLFSPERGIAGVPTPKSKPLIPDPKPQTSNLKPQTQTLSPSPSLFLSLSL